MKSNDITNPLTHVTRDQKSFESMSKNGIKIKAIYDMIKPSAFWISMNYDWERWCRKTNFWDIDKAIICDVILKPDLNLFQVTTLDDAIKLTDILLPGYEPKELFGGWKPAKCDMLTFTYYMIEQFREGNGTKNLDLWKSVMQDYDGVYYIKSGHLAMDSFFNAWDCDSIAVFDPRNISVTNPRLGIGLEKELVID